MNRSRVHRRPLVRPLPLAAVATIAALLGTGIVAAPAVASPSTAGRTDRLSDPARYVDPFIGTSNDGNTWPGATAPFGMVQWSPTGTAGDQTSTPVANGYSYDVNRLRGFSLTHLNGAGCAPGAAGDVPIMPVTTPSTTSPSADSTDAVYAAGYSARPGVREPRPLRRHARQRRPHRPRRHHPRRHRRRSRSRPGKDANLLFRTSNSINGSEAATTRVDPRTRTVSGSVLTGGFCSRRAQRRRRHQPGPPQLLPPVLHRDLRPGVREHRHLEGRHGPAGRHVLLRWGGLPDRRRPCRTRLRRVGRVRRASRCDGAREDRHLVRERGGRGREPRRRGDRRARPSPAWRPAHGPPGTVNCRACASAAARRTGPPSSTRPSTTHSCSRTR